MISVIIPAANESAWIGPCLAALLDSDPVAAEVIVVPNGCTDDTAGVARTFAAQAAARGWGFRVVELAQGSKPAALNAGDAAAGFGMRLYLDADVEVTPALLPRIAAALDVTRPRYAAATPVIPRAASPVTRAYARVWQRLPFARSSAGGFGLYAVNPAGRARWGAFPPILSDDTFVRLQFTPEERVQVGGTYRWPLPEGFARLVRARRRQDAGVAEVARNWPGLMAREGKVPLGLRGLGGLALRDPAGVAVYAAVTAAVRGRPAERGFTRGR